MSASFYLDPAEIKAQCREAIDNLNEVSSNTINVEHKLDEFINDIKDCDKASVPLEIEVHKTPNGHAVIVSRGFDTRELMKKWSSTVELKKDEMLCVDWTGKEN